MRLSTQQGTGNLTARVGILLIQVAWSSRERRLRLMLKFRLLLILMATGAVLASPGICAVARSSRRAPAGPSRPSRPLPRTAFRATNYEIRASLDAVGQVLNAQAKVDFTANEAPPRRGCRTQPEPAGELGSRRRRKPVSYDRDETLRAETARHSARHSARRGKSHAAFDYSGPLSSRITILRKACGWPTSARTADICCFRRAGSR